MSAWRRFSRLLLKLHRWLLPQRADIGWTPYLWLFYLSFFVGHWLRDPPTPTVLMLSAASLLIFLVFYFNAYWQTGLRIVWNIAAIISLGAVWSSSNFGAMTFFIFGAGFCGFVGPPKVGSRVLVAIIGSVLLTFLVVDLPWFWFAMTAALCFIIGATNIYYSEVSRKNADLRRSREEVERLAAVAERERIARDLHDLLGHTLTLITIKSELARRLSERGDARATREIADVEQISRDALAQVREAVTGFRDIGFSGEVARARVACEAAGIELVCELEDLELEPRSEATLAMVLREAVTNVVRHSRASRCHVHLQLEGSGSEGTGLCLSVTDDGRGGRPRRPGQGLDSMRHRLESLGGLLELDGDSGWALKALLPETALSQARKSAEPAEEPALFGRIIESVTS